MNEEEMQQPRQRFLALDTATTVMAASLMDGRQVIGEAHVQGERNHSVHIITELQRLLTDAGMTGRDIAGLAVGVGPGSYTGIRIAVTAAKTLAWAWKVPVAGVSTLHALAWGGWVRGQNGLMDKHAPLQDSAVHWIIPLLDARRGQVYTGLFAADGEGAPIRLEQDGIRLMTSWVEELKQRLSDTDEGSRPAVLWFVGEIALHVQAAADLEIPVQALPYELEGRWIGRLGAERLLNGEQDELHTLVPNYTQLAEAEVNLLRQR
ncbi:tRNA (adenosine(37)-N6)-threonylcarbamoyltransferase complex dimerization subunit type 1 TsaB [Paenibacillus sp. P96]|uniref:tRNA (Adenosine(37)-N6)-threonylcarbamoyltransferase complex dimerization subunit type 1 TsaB n=1 Tax=Paenibacillus zeirhizosphaerae TaxID=2987519 RepID=A0ABT9FW12_9BACL|nr:tRNA (adenosine(37)-N6)-threonylcarbamoyltransferase complex dimerization subunit type 1 TsaB [Paenibacillus sp. P96]MDP4098923.1 tRNA (adenosine(37)-N6)-threonylcarbamoyltransferase complex dimerization subunit type 1 TsaB [Paenibacillus sp. P96]